MKSLENTCMFCMTPLPKPGGFCPHCGKNNAEITNSPHQLVAGSILAGTYLVGCVLGQGGFGITYVGWDLNLDQKVAIKEYYPEGCVTRELTQHATVLPLTGDKGDFFQRGRQKFVEEARALARFSGDPCIVNVRSFFSENGTAYIVMDFVEGKTLKKYAAARGGRLGGQETLRLLAPLMGSLARVHDAGLLHRDIAPDNIILQPNGTVKLLDFGAARAISAQGEHSNTINVKHGFAPEEQYRTHGEQGPWTDVYALAATIYYLTTGTVPPQALDRVLSGEPLVPPSRWGVDFTPQQDAAVMHGLAAKAQERTRDMRQFAAELFGPPQTDRAAPPREQTPPQTGASAPAGKRKRGIIIGVAAAAAAALVGLVIVGIAVGSGGKKQSVSAPAVRTPEPQQTVEAAPAETPTQTSAAPANTQTPAGTQAPAVTPSPEPEPDSTLVFGDFSINVYGDVCEIADYLGDSTEVEVPGTISGHPVVGIGFAAFYDKPVTRVTLPEGIRYIGDAAFEYCASLMELNLPESLESIGYFSFSDCKSLAALDVPANVSYISAYAFDTCRSLTLSVSPDNRWYAAEDTVLFSFDRTVLHTYLCSKPERSYTVPDGVRTIAEGAFCDADNLRELQIPDSVTVLEDQVFFGCDALETVYLSAYVEALGMGAFACTDARIRLDANNPYYVMSDGVLYSADMTLLHTYPHYLTDNAFSVPEGVGEIATLAFYDASALNSLTLPDSLRIIRDRAFMLCENLPEIVLPEGVHTLGWRAFAYCSLLKKAVLPKSLIVINDDAFANCDALTVYAPSGSDAAAYAKNNGIPCRAG